MEGSQADSLQILQALVHLEGLSQGHSTFVANGITGKPVRDTQWWAAPTHQRSKETKCSWASVVVAVGNQVTLIVTLWKELRVRP